MSGDRPAWMAEVSDLVDPERWLYTLGGWGIWSVGEDDGPGWAVGPYTVEMCSGTLAASLDHGDDIPGTMRRLSRMLEVDAITAERDALRIRLAVMRERMGDAIDDAHGDPYEVIRCLESALALPEVPRGE